MKRTMLLAAYDAVESLASLSSRVESRFRSDKKRTLKSAPVVGHNGFRYRVHSDWGIPDEPSRYPVKDCHEMVVDSLGRIVLLTNHRACNLRLCETRSRAQRPHPADQQECADRLWHERCRR